MVVTSQKDSHNLGTGMLLMAFFTFMWSGIAASGETSTYQLLSLPTFTIIGILLLYNGLKLLRHKNSGHFGQENARRKLAGIFSLEAIAIAVTSASLYATNHGAYVLLAIALIVGLHFYLIGRLFHRTFDFYLATLVVVVAAWGIMMLAQGVLSKSAAITIVGIATATATSAYGLYMLRIDHLTKPS